MNRRYTPRPDQIDSAAFIAPGAVVVGDVTIAAQASVWFNAVARGDTERIVIGPSTNVQDTAVLHADPGFPCLLGARVTVGHAAVVHGAEIADDVLIGMGAVVMNGAQVGAGSIVAAGAVVTAGTNIPPGSLAMGCPARVRREATADDRAQIAHAANHYVQAGEAARGEYSTGGETDNDRNE